MAKIRGVKPDFWTDDDVVELTIPARLLFIGLWNYACDNGHLQDRPKQIKTRILPADDVDVNALLDELAGQGVIQRRDGVILVPNLAKHQKPHRRWWTTCDVPGCSVPDGASSGPVNRGTTVVQRESNRGTTDEVVDGDGDGDGDVSGKRTAPRTPTPKRATRLPDGWTPSPEHEQRAAESAIDIAREVIKFRAHAEDKGRVSKSWNAAFTQWLIKATEYAPRTPTPDNVARPTFWDRTGPR